MQDLLYAVRFLRKRWGVASVSVAVMGLGIGLTATMFAIIDGVVFAGPDYPGLDRITYLQTTIPQSQFHQSVRVHDYLDWREQQTVFDAMAAYIGTPANLSGDESRAETYPGVRMTASVFDLTGVLPFMGRPFTEEEAFSPDPGVVLLGYDVWVNRYDRDPDIVGATIRVNARPTTVIGVMPQDFRFPETHDVWLPLGVEPAELERREGPGLQVVGRLAEGVSIEEARTQLTGVATRLTQQFPEANRDIVPVLSNWVDEQFVDNETKGLLYTMFVAVIGVLLIACANVANLLFGLTIGRGKELAIRTAMGAARRRVLLQLMNETFVLAAGGAVLGVGLSKLGLDVFSRVVVELNPPPWMVFELNFGVILFVIGLTFVAALVSGLLPAIHATRTDVHAILQDQSRGSSSRSVSRWSSSLVGLEVALSCALLVAAGLMIRSTLQVSGSDYGVRRDGILTARIGLPAATYSDSLARKGFADRLITELEGLPGVQSVALSSGLPVMGTGMYFYGVRDREYVDDSEYVFGGLTRVSPDFFGMFEVPLAAGRGFEESDDLGGQHVVVVDRRFVDLNWPGEDAIGKQLRLGRSDSENPWLTVVGVVETFEMTGPLDFGGESPPGMFVPYAQQPVGALAISLRVAGDPLAAATPLRQLIARLDPDIPVNDVNTFEARLDQRAIDFKIIGGMFTVFGLVALLLASIGLYAVMAFSVGRRTTEVGVRMALGANGGKIVRLVLGQGSRPLAVGLGIGLLLAYLLGRALATFLFRVSALDPVTYAGVPLLLVAVSFAALLIPARRASRIAPVIALRDD